MKILFIHSMSPFLPQGGAEVSLRCLLRSLRSKGHECVLLVTGPNSGVKESCNEGVRIIELGLRNFYWPFDKRDRSAVTKLAWHAVDSFNVFMRSAVARVCAQEQPDVASVHNLPGWSVTVWDALNESGVPVVQVLHDQYLLCATSNMFRGGRNCEKQCATCTLLRLPHRAKSQKISAVIGVSRFILKHHVRNGYFKGVPLQEVIYNARSASGYTACDKKLPIDSGRSGPRFGFIGSITPSKGIKYLIDSFVSSKLSVSELLIAGDLSSGYARALRDSSANPAIRFLGRVSPDEFFPNVDVLILPSLWRDTFPGVVFESFIYGRPVVVVNHGGAPEIVKHGVNGLVFDPNDPSALSNALKYLSGAPDEIRHLARGASREASYFLDTSRWADEFLTTYSRAANAVLSGA